MITVKRSCNSSNRVEPERIIFNSFVIEMTATHATRFASIHKYLFDDRFDRVQMACTLEDIIDIGLFEMIQNIKHEQQGRYEE